MSSDHIQASKTVCAPSSSPQLCTQTSLGDLNTSCSLSKSCKIHRTHKMFDLLGPNKVKSDKLVEKIENQTVDEVHWMECSDLITDKICLYSNKEKRRQKAKQLKSKNQYHSSKTNGSILTYGSPVMNDNSFHQNSQLSLESENQYQFTVLHSLMLK